MTIAQHSGIGPAPGGGTEGEPWPMLIDGEWAQAVAGARFDVLDPGLGSVIAQVAEGRAEDVDRAVAAARAAFE